ncbi:hypothetical protein H0H87_011484 [Tephrocybe sp. NHM501043]|nr:hypothetical protein H0H87_011484 [Tephrocybe sp. NHM501043]
MLTVASRTKYAWKTAFPIAIKEHSKTRIVFSGNGQVLTITWGATFNQELNLQSLKKAAAKSLKSLDTAIQDALPSSFDYAQFSLINVKDDFQSDNSLFDRGDNLETLQPFIDELLREFNVKSRPGSNEPSFVDVRGKSNAKKVDDVLDRFQKISDALLLSFVLTCGVPPRAWQVLRLVFRQDGAFHRNVCVHRNGCVLITNPRAKQRDTCEFAAFWALVPKLGTALLFYLGVIRPIVISILHERSIPAHDQNIFIFARPTRRTTAFTLIPYEYTTSDLNAMLIRSDFGMETRVLRHVIIAILRQHFSHLMKASNMDDSPGDRQSQHKFNTSLYNYAPDETFQVTGVSTVDCEQQITVSYTIQQFYGLNSKIGDNLEIIHDIDRFRHQALECARLLVLNRNPGYGFGQMTPAERICKLEDLKAERPFVLRLKRKLSDDVLVQVTSALIYGQRALPLSLPPPNGYETRHPATATAIIMMALEEWSDGIYQSFADWSEIATMMNECISQAEVHASKMKEANRKAWMNFSSRVHTCAVGQPDPTPRRALCTLSMDISSPD